MSARLCVAAFLLLLPLAARSQQATPRNELAGIGALITSGNVEEADCRLREMLERATAESDEPRIAAAHLLLAWTAVARRQPDAARAGFEQAAARYRRIGDHFGVFLTCWMSAELERAEGQNDEAIDGYERALAALQAAQTTPFSIDSLTALASIVGFSMEAFAPLAAVPEILKPIMLRFAEAICRQPTGDHPTG